jgi:acyl-CoA dehydrogenase-like protein
MDFGLSDQRQEVQRWAAGLPARLGGTTYARSLREDSGAARSGYAQLAAAGVLELGLGENDPFDRALVHEQLGSGLVFSPAMESAVFAAAFLTALGPERSGELLQQITGGSAIVALAPQLLALAGKDGPAEFELGPVRTPWFEVASHVLVPQRGADGSLAVSFVPIADFTRGGRALYMNTLGVGELLLPPGQPGGARLTFAGADIRPALDTATAALLGVLASFCLGGARRAVALAADYAKARHQFGRPIGSFQAQQHKLATAELRTRQAQHLVYAAADSAGQAGPASAQASFYPAAACHLALRAFREAAQTASLVHGGYGLALEFDIHLYFVYSKLLETIYGPLALSCLRRAVVGASPGTTPFEPRRENHA